MAKKWLKDATAPHLLKKFPLLLMDTTFNLHLVFIIEKMYKLDKPAQLQLLVVSNFNEPEEFETDK